MSEQCHTVNEGQPATSTPGRARPSHEICIPSTSCGKETPLPIRMTPNSFSDSVDSIVFERILRLGTIRVLELTATVPHSYRTPFTPKSKFQALGLSVPRPYGGFSYSFSYSFNPLLLLTACTVILV